jgi:hypothetical protein
MKIENVTAISLSSEPCSIGVSPKFDSFQGLDLHTSMAQGFFKDISKNYTRSILQRERWCYVRLNPILSGLRGVDGVSL